MRHSVSDLSALIKDRRTIYPKDHSDRIVQRDVVERILGNAVWAPTHGMTQPWRFHVFMEKGRERLSAFLGEEYTRLTSGADFMPRKYEKLTQRPLQSSVTIALGLKRDPTGRINATDEQWAMACAVQNMYLTCAAFGLAGFWATGKVLTGEGIRDFIGLGSDDRCMGLFFVGYPAVEWPRGYRKPLPDVTQWHTS